MFIYRFHFRFVLEISRAHNVEIEKKYLNILANYYYLIGAEKTPRNRILRMLSHIVFLLRNIVHTQIVQTQKNQKQNIFACIFILLNLFLYDGVVFHIWSSRSRHYNCIFVTHQMYFSE